MQIRQTAVAFAVMGVAQIAAAQAQQDEPSSVQLYGQVTSAAVYTNHQTASDIKLKELANNPLAVSMFGLRGSENIGGGMRGLFRLESALSSDSGLAGATVASTAKFWNRQSYVGLMINPATTLTVGRQLHAGTDRVVQSFDPFNVAGWSLHDTPLAMFGVNRYVGNDSRVDDSAKLRFTTPSGFTTAASMGADDGEGRSYSLDIAQTGTLYNVGVYAMNINSPTLTPVTGARAKHNAAGVGGNVLVGPVRLYAHYMESTFELAVANRLTQKNKIAVVGAKVNVTQNFELKVMYYHDKGVSLNGVSGRDGVKTTVIGAAEYFLSKRTSLTAAFSTNKFTDGYMLEPTNISALGRNPNASSVSRVSTGIIHRF